MRTRTVQWAFTVACMLTVGLVAGCATAAAPPSPTSAPPSATTAPPPSPTSAPSPSPSPAVIRTLGRGETSLTPGTYRLDLNKLAPASSIFPPIEVTVPEGWNNLDGWIVNRPRAGFGLPPVAIQFWDVKEVYGHPCDWNGTLFDPGPGVDDLANALVAIPLRNATEPVDVTVGGFEGKYLEWSVPGDMRATGDDFLDCDEASPGLHDFLSWTGRGPGTDRYHQGPGQVDLLWILDVNGSRLVIDAFEMPGATQAERDEIRQVVDSITFETNP